MKAALFSLVALALSPLAKAETFQCTFTEPFLDVRYSTDTQILVMSDALNHKTTTHRNVKFLIVGPADFQLLKSGKELARLTLNFQGSDGMSETVFPYKIKMSSLSRFANGGVGGCASSLLKAKTPAN